MKTLCTIFWGAGFEWGQNLRTPDLVLRILFNFLNRSENGARPSVTGKIV